MANQRIISITADGLLESENGKITCPVDHHNQCRTSCAAFNKADYQTGSHLNCGMSDINIGVMAPPATAETPIEPVKVD